MPMFYCFVFIVKVAPVLNFALILFTSSITLIRILLIIKKGNNGLYWCGHLCTHINQHIAYSAWRMLQTVPRLCSLSLSLSLFLNGTMMWQSNWIIHPCSASSSCFSSSPLVSAKLYFSIPLSATHLILFFALSEFPLSSQPSISFHTSGCQIAAHNECRSLGNCMSLSHHF